MLKDNDVEFHQVTRNNSFYKKQIGDKIWYVSRFGNTECANLFLNSCSVFDDGITKEHSCTLVQVKELDEYIDFLKYIRDDILL